MLRILRTTTFSFTIIYVFVFAIAVGLLALLFYQNTFGAMSKQTDAIVDREIKVLSDEYSAKGAGFLRRAINDRAAWRDDGLYLLIAEPAGAVLSGNLTALPTQAVNAGEGFINFSFERPLYDAANREIGVETREARGKIRRFKAAPDADQSYLVFVARDISTREDLRRRTQSIMAQIGLATIALGIIVGLVFSRALLRRVDSVNRTARLIRDGDMSKRIALTGAGDELESLAINLNAMLDQIERLMEGMKEVSDNIAHDLRSPLNRIRGRLTEAMKGGAEEKEAALRSTLNDAENMIVTFNALLSIARIESGEGAGSMEAVDLKPIAEEMVELYEPAAQEAGFALQLKAAPAPPVRASRELISQALANLLDNSLKYAMGGSTIRIDIRAGSNSRVLLSVLDDGPGVPPEERGSVVNRFVRLEQSRSTPGSGLGLSLVSAIARAHRGALTLGDSFSGEAARRGLKVTLALPAFGRA